MGFSKQQRQRYIELAKPKGYVTEIIVLHQPYAVCLTRCLERKGHETIKDEAAARGALDMFFSRYERPEDNEADTVTRIWPDGFKRKAIIVDLDGTLCNCEHRRHHVRPDNPTEGFRKNWKAFFDGIKDDTVNEWCEELVKHLRGKYEIVFCSGRGSNYRRPTLEWIEKHLKWVEYQDFTLYMRPTADSRQDNIVKEIILDFEILTRHKAHLAIDDRSQVVQMWRKRGITCLQCDEGNF